MKARKRIAYVDQPPEGLFYLPSYLSAAEENQLLQNVAAQPFEPYDHHGYKANREVVYFGVQGGYNGVGAEDKAEPMPEWLVPVRDKLAGLIGLHGDELAMALVAQYKPGAGIGWHRDRPQFGPTVLGISLGSDAEMRFRRFVEDTEEMFKIKLEHGSAYLISGPARSVWQHGMNSVSNLRYSITFRTIRDKNSNSADPRHAPDQLAQRLSALLGSLSTQQASSERAQQLKLAL
ncbi:MAG TPA: alpha-ketoglutarate-dependent dioxygenase AlkB [Candidatus Obscuribacterales bacterium]